MTTPITSGFKLWDLAGQTLQPREGLEVWQEIMVRLPFVCSKCSRRFPRLPLKGYCPDHLPTTRIKVTDQTQLAVDRGWVA